MGLLIMLASVVGAFLAGMHDQSWAAIPITAVIWFAGYFIAVPSANQLWRESNGMALLGPLLVANGLVSAALFGAGRLIAVV